MKKIIKKIAILITSVVVVMMIVSQILFKNPLSLLYIPVWIIEARKGIDEEYNKAIKKEETNREENRILAEKWLINTYGDIISEATTIEFSNRSQGWGVDSVFRIESPFATGSIYVNSETKEVDGGFNLSGIKFQHLYSNWVKKQVGIEDENVELELDCGKIDFSKIKILNETYDEVFENCSYILRSINIKNKDGKERYRIFNEYRTKFYDKLNKNKDNLFALRFNEEDYIGIRDYIKIGKKDYKLQELEINQNRSIKIVCEYKQLNNIFNRIDSINKLIEELIPNESTKEKKWIDILEDKLYSGSVLRLDLSNINEYVLDAIYYDIPSKYYIDNKPKLYNPTYIRYVIKLEDSIFKIVNYKEIHHSEYIGNKNVIYKCEHVVDSVIIDVKSDYNTNEIEFYSLRVTGQPDEEKINKVLSKKLREVTKIFIETNVNNLKMVNSRIQKKYLFNVFLQTGDYIILESSIVEDYIVLDLQEYRFIENRIIAKDDAYIMIEIENKKFLIYNKTNRDSFIDYRIIEQAGDKIKINFYAEKFDDQSKSSKYNWHNYIVDFNNKTMEEMILKN